MSECEHPKSQQYAYYDGATVCNECGCVIAQYGKPIDPYSLSPSRDEYASLRSDSALLDRVRSECRVSPYCPGGGNDIELLNVTGPPDLLRLLAEWLTGEKP